jgi:hypothetical protein
MSDNVNFNEGSRRQLTISNSNNLKRGMCFWDLPFTRDSQQREEHNHRTATSSKPEWTGNTIIITNKRWAEQGCWPEPWLYWPLLLVLFRRPREGIYRYHGWRSKTRANSTICCHEPVLWVSLCWGLNGGVLTFQSSCYLLRWFSSTLWWWASWLATISLDLKIKG